VFSSEELISFVFANESDIYYGDDLLKLNLHQFLWKQLHENYEKVYFLQADDGLFQVHTFGDKGSETDWRKLKWGKSEIVKQGSWLQKQLDKDRRAAIVCSLEDFCTVLEDARWKETLEKIAADKNRRGKIVLTASETAERSRKYLLDSRVFNWLDEKAVTDARAGSRRPLYPQIKSGKGEGFVFLNTFTRDRVRNLLIHIMMENPERFCDGAELEALTAALVNYLNVPRLQQTVLFPEIQEPLCYLRYRDLYRLLQDAYVWERLLRLKDTCPRQETREPKLQILRDKRSFAGKCILLRLPRWLRESQDDGRWAENTLEKIRQEVRVPKNRPENPEIIAHIEKYLDRLDTFYEPDIQTYQLVLEAMEFCTQWLYLENNSEKIDKFQETVENLDACIAKSSQCYMLRRDISTHSPDCSYGSLMALKLDQMKKELNVSEQECNKLQEAVKISILEFSKPEDTVDAGQLLEKTVKKMEKQDEKPEITFDDDFVFTPDMYNYRPPTLKNHS